MDKHRLEYLIKRLRSQEITPGERDELDAYWQRAQNDDTRFNQLTSGEKDTARRLIYEGVKARTGISEDIETPVRSISIVPWMLRIAASIAVVAAVLFYSNRESGGDSLVYQTTFGEQLSVVLPDQSKVVLNGNSKLHFQPWPANGSREVWIEGEAYFEVVHTQSHQKFIVHTGNEMDVRVLGTKFNVKNRGGKAEVMLQEGSVRLDIAIDASRETIMMSPGELATLHNATLYKTTVKAEEYVSWTENKLFFDQTPLREVAEILQDTYGMTVVFEGEALAERKLSGEISVYQVDDILKAIKASMEIEVSRAGDTVTFHQMPVETI